MSIYNLTIETEISVREQNQQICINYLIKNQSVYLGM